VLLFQTFLEITAIRIAAKNYIDLQVNGYAGVDFNSDGLRAEMLHAACQRLRSDGVAGILATIITAAPEKMLERLKNLAELRSQDRLAQELIWGIHIEGPFISPAPGFVGAHPPQHVQPANVALMQRLLDAADGWVRMVTLAPEQDADFKLTKLLSQKNIVVAAGHCDPSLEILQAAIDAGLSMFTHLGNGCPMMLSRHDNIIQRVLALSDLLWISVIADGAHLPFFVLRNFLRTSGIDRALVVTDATAASGMGPGHYRLGEIEAIVGDDLTPRLAGDPQYLAGSALTMPVAVQNLREHLHLTDREIASLCADNPRSALRMSTA
jgi:N-acetylglucosamine-6-phosphate deacetylase